MRGVGRCRVDRGGCVLSCSLQGYAKEVLTKYRELMAAKRPKALPELDTVRSMMKTERENRVGSVLQREQRVCCPPAYATAAEMAVIRIWLEKRKWSK